MPAVPKGKHLLPAVVEKLSVFFDITLIIANASALMNPVLDPQLVLERLRVSHHPESLLPALGLPQVD